MTQQVALKQGDHCIIIQVNAHVCAGFRVLFISIMGPTEML